MEPNYQLPPEVVPRRPLPNAVTVLVLGILSIIFCFVCGVVALIIGAQDIRMYKENPEMFSSSSYDMLQAGRICSIVSLCLWAAIILFVVAALVFSLSIASLNWK